MFFGKLILLGVLTLAPLRCLAQESFVKAIDSMKRSVAPVVCLTVGEDGAGKLDIIAGSAFFVSSDGTFVTARHVLAEMEPSPFRRPCNVAAIYFPLKGKWPDDGRLADAKWFTFPLDKCLMSNQTVDLARCKTKDDLSRQKDIAAPIPVTIDSVLPPEGIDVAFMGFPLQISLPRASRATIAGYGSRDNVETTEMVIDRATWPGASGSPVFLMNGHVVGVVLARGTNDAAGLAFARTGNELDKFLKSN